MPNSGSATPVLISTRGKNLGVDCPCAQKNVPDKSPSRVVVWALPTFTRKGLQRSSLRLAPAEALWVLVCGRCRETGRELPSRMPPWLQSVRKALSEVKPDEASHRLQGHQEV